MYRGIQGGRETKFQVPVLSSGPQKNKKREKTGKNRKWTKKPGMGGRRREIDFMKMIVFSSRPVIYRLPGL
jgi:hypothetical protein